MKDRGKLPHGPARQRDPCRGVGLERGQNATRPGHNRAQYPAPSVRLARAREMRDMARFLHSTLSTSTRQWRVLQVGTRERCAGWSMPLGASVERRERACLTVSGGPEYDTPRRVPGGEHGEAPWSERGQHGAQGLPQTPRTPRVVGGCLILGLVWRWLATGVYTVGPGRTRGRPARGQGGAPASVYARQGVIHRAARVCQVPTLSGGT